MKTKVKTTAALDGGAIPALSSPSSLDFVLYGDMRAGARDAGPGSVMT